MRKEKNVTEEMAIDSLCAFYSRNKRVPRQCEAVKKNGLYSYRLYYRVLGCDSWGEVIKKSGLPPFKKKIPEDAIVTKEQAEESLIMFYKKHNRRPLVREGYASFQLHSIATYKKIFEEKNWKQLLDKAGLPGKNETKQRNL